jgi:hypothetical protein
MNKKMTVILAGALLTLSMAGNALAAFSGDDLIRVVYNTAGGTVENATDLGSVATLIADTSGTVVGGGAAAFTANGIASGSFGNSAVAYFAVSTLENGTTGKYLYVSGSPTIASGIGGLKFASLGAGTGAIGTLEANYAAAAGSNSYVQGDTSINATTYYKTLDASGSNTGGLGGFMNAASKGNTEASLATLASTPVTQGLWYFAAANNTTAAGALALTLQTNADGSTTVINGNVASTPIPPSFFLMGSGLLGMVGLRRKKRA